MFHALAAITLAAEDLLGIARMPHGARINAVLAGGKPFVLNEAAIALNHPALGVLPAEVSKSVHGRAHFRHIRPAADFKPVTILNAAGVI